MKNQKFHFKFSSYLCDKTQTRVPLTEDKTYERNLKLMFL